MLPDYFHEWFRYRWSWPPYCPDLNPCDYFLWDFLKNTVSKCRLHTIEELQQGISAPGISINEETLAAVV
jgi:hypothetical protein